MKRGSIVAPLLATLLLSSCAQDPPRQAQARWALTATSGINLDALGQPAPLVVRVYVLAARDAFDRATFFELYDHDREVLGQQAIERTVLVLKPGERVRFSRPLDPRAGAFAVLAAYQRIDTAKWRAVVDVGTSMPQKNIDIAARFDASGVAIGLTAPGPENDERGLLWRLIRPLWKKLGGSSGADR